jgi:nucleoside-diphosphate-sugar epimerase
MERNSDTVSPHDLILITGAAGFIGPSVLANLLGKGFLNLRCLVRPSSDLPRIHAAIGSRRESARVDIMKGNLLSPQDCSSATDGVSLILHLAAGRGEKSFPDAFMNSVVSTRNLLDACLRNGRLVRFVTVSSFSVYTNRQRPWWRTLDETSPVEGHPELRGEAYCFAKVKQDDLVVEYGKRHKLPYVIVRPGVVYGPGKPAITGRVGVGTFGVFLHLGGSNKIPFTYVDNCAEAIVLAGLTKGVDGETFNVVDDDLPSSRQFLRLYKRNVRRFKSIYMPHLGSYLLCYFWEKYAEHSHDQLPPVFNRRKWHAFWKGSRYSNDKLKRLLGWRPTISTSEGMRRYFDSCREMSKNA